MYIYRLGDKVTFNIIKKHKIIRKWCKRYKFKIEESRLTDSFMSVLIVKKKCRGKYISIIIRYNPYWNIYSVLREIYLSTKDYLNLPETNS